MAAEKQQGDTGGTLRKLAVPAAVSVAGAAVGVAWRKKPNSLRDAMPDLRGDGVADLAGDLKDKVGSAITRIQDGVGGDDSKSQSSPDARSEELVGKPGDLREYAEHRADREQRRAERRRHLEKG